MHVVNKELVFVPAHMPLPELVSSTMEHIGKVKIYRGSPLFSFPRFTKAELMNRSH